jgi:multidrug resistance efflux pump
MENPDHEWKQGWKPSNRPQSTVAKNFMSELDSLFKLDGDLDTLDKNVHQKKQAVTTQTQELEALEARLRAAEDRLKQAGGSSPPRRKDSPRRSPLEGAFPAQEPARADGSSAQKTAERPSSSVPVEAEKA